ncbi:hypothetical protein LOY34_17170 [Pseudomonas sp. B21-009]|uniref:hypothetical protein n=1 Tax=Pseudomonas sp. B21-009 TaxID=2895470 RepID=UPI00215F5D50|nr:hypothetical protein [Pseudomonas sp. B21-009]UVM65064.1 hypothetical protein LOY34_17170 [Pseudomonas sp. B21-009]
MQAALRSCDQFDVMDVPAIQIRAFSTVLADFFVTDNVDPSCRAKIETIELFQRGTIVYTEAEESYTQDVSEEIMAKQAINVEGWQLALAALTVLAGSYYFAWDSHKALLTEISGLRTDLRSDKKDADDDLKKLISELKTEREADRQQARVDSEALREELAKVRETQAKTIEALGNLKK